MYTTANKCKCIEGLYWMLPIFLIFFFTADDDLSNSLWKRKNAQQKY